MACSSPHFAIAAISVFLVSAAVPSLAQTPEVNVYSARHYDTDNALYENFTKQTGIKVNLIEAQADQLIERIKAEGQNSPADVLITVDAGRLWRAADAGVLQPVKSTTLEQNVPANLRDPEGQWFGLTRRVRLIVYNKDKVKPGEIATYEELADPKWKGRVCIRSSTNVYNQSLVGSMIEALGADKAESWAKGVVSNLARQPKGGDTDQIKAVAAGECDVGVTNHYYLVRLIKSQKADDQAVANKIGVVFPNQNGRGTHTNISGAGVAKFAPHRENAIKFIEYLSTPEAQAIFTKGNYEFPIREGVAIDPVLTGWGDFKTDQLNSAVYGRNNPEALKLTDRAGWR